VAQPCWAQLALEAYRFQTTAWPAGAWPPHAVGGGSARTTARAGAPVKADNTNGLFP
jgi:hypothetical protein